MALQDAVQFIELVEKDTTLQQQVQSRNDAIRLGADKGLTFTADELSEAYSSRKEEMSDDDLKNASGGFAGFLW